MTYAWAVLFGAVFLVFGDAGAIFSSAAVVALALSTAAPLLFWAIRRCFQTPVPPSTEAAVRLAVADLRSPLFWFVVVHVHVNGSGLPVGLVIAALHGFAAAVVVATPDAEAAERRRSTTDGGGGAANVSSASLTWTLVLAAAVASVTRVHHRWVGADALFGAAWSAVAETAAFLLSRHLGYARNATVVAVSVGALVAFGSVLIPRHNGAGGGNGNGHQLQPALSAATTLLTSSRTESLQMLSLQTFVMNGLVPLWYLLRLGRRDGTDGGGAAAHTVVADMSPSDIWDGLRALRGVETSFACFLCDEPLRPMPHERPGDVRGWAAPCCGARFHDRCLAHWCAKWRRCPKCRADLVSPP